MVLHDTEMLRGTMKCKFVHDYLYVCACMHLCCVRCVCTCVSLMYIMHSWLNLLLPYADVCSQEKENVLVYHAVISVFLLSLP